MRKESLFIQREVWDMSSRISNLWESLFRRIPIVKRITVWYTIFIFLIVSSLFVVSFLVLDDLVIYSSKGELEKEVNQAAHDKDISRIRSFDDGIFFSVYDEEGNLLRGDRYIDEEDAPILNDGKFSDISIEDNNYSIYDVFVENKKEPNKSYWVRGVMPLDSIKRDTTTLMFLTLVISPILMLIIIYGGYLITKNAFKPINNIVKTASEIERSGDLSQRIDVGYGNDEINRMSAVFNRMLESLEISYNREKDFTGNAAHELKTPLSVISLESQYILDYGKDINEAKEAMKIIKSKSMDMNKLIDQLLQLSRLDKENFSKEEVNISEIIESYIDDRRSSIEEKGISIHLNVDKDIRLYTNETMFIRIFDNLVSNAIKFTKDSISVSLLNTSDNPGYTQLTVSDNGCGISKDHIERIWDRFYQVDQSRNKDVNIGYGIGLSIVKKFVDIQNWDIEVESEENKGSIFIIKMH